MAWVPAIDRVESAKEFTLTAELPGMDQKLVVVSIDGANVALSMPI
jgi:HSP20 family molecular chaperone IbpA